MLICVATGHGVVLLILIIDTDATTIISAPESTTLVDSGVDVVPSASSNVTVPAAVGGAIVGIVVGVVIGVVFLVILIVIMTIVITVMWKKNNRKWTIAASNGVARTNEYPLANPIYTGNVN